MSTTPGFQPFSGHRMNSDCDQQGGSTFEYSPVDRCSPNSRSTFLGARSRSFAGPADRSWSFATHSAYLAHAARSRSGRSDPHHRTPRQHAFTRIVSINDPACGNASRALSDSIFFRTSNEWRPFSSLPLQHHCVASPQRFKNISLCDLLDILLNGKNIGIEPGAKGLCRAVPVGQEPHFHSLHHHVNVFVRDTGRPVPGNTIGQMPQ